MSIRKEKIEFFEKRLADFFRKAGRVELPWREPRKTSSRGKGKITAYEVWVSEIMLQQTQVVRAIGYYENFLKRFPTVIDLASASWEEFLPYYDGLGYYARGRNMLKAARMVVDVYGSVFPRNRETLEKLPGVGSYTAAAIMSFAYGENHLAWDTNLKRVIGRFFFGGKHLVTDEVFWEEALSTPKKEMNAALMDFGSALCTARPKCEACSLRSRCVYFRERGKQEVRLSATGKREKTDTRWKDAQVHVFLHERHVKYYSPDKKMFRPFVLPVGCHSRNDIKRYFQEKYGLKLAVRPPHWKGLVGEAPTLFVNAQILLGEPGFPVFSKSALKGYTEDASLNK